MSLGTPTHLGAAFAATSTAAQNLGSITAGVGDRVQVTCADDGSDSTYAVTDSAGNTYTLKGTAQQLTNNYNAQTFESVLTVALVGGTITGTKSGGVGGTWDRIITAQRLTGTGLTGDQSAQATGTGTAWSSGNTGVTTAADEVVFGVVADGGASGSGGSVSIPGGGATELYDSGTTSAFVDLVVQYLIVASAGVQSASGTLSNSDNWAASAFTVKESGGGAPPDAPLIVNSSGVRLA